MNDWKNNVSFILVEPKESGNIGASARAMKNMGFKNLETKIMRNLEHLIGRAGLTDWELKMLHGICSQVEKKI